MCLVQVDMVMVALSYGWYGLFFMKNLVDVDNKVVVSSVLIITGTIGLLHFRGRMGVPQRRYILYIRRFCQAEDRYSTVYVSWYWCRWGAPDGPGCSGGCFLVLLSVPRELYWYL